MKDEDGLPDDGTGCRKTSGAFYRQELFAEKNKAANIFVSARDAALVFGIPPEIQYLEKRHEADEASAITQKRKPFCESGMISGLAKGFEEWRNGPSGTGRGRVKVLKISKLESTCRPRGRITVRSFP